MAIVTLPTGQKAEFHMFGECKVLITQDEVWERGLLRERWHLSISHPRRYPTWEEMRDARYKFLPNGITMAMLLPPKEEYINVHPNCFHWHEIEVGKRTC